MQPSSGVTAWSRMNHRRVVTARDRGRTAEDKVRSSSSLVSFWVSIQQGVYTPYDPKAIQLDYNRGDTACKLEELYL